jgi:hypothetical protein
MNQEQKEEAPAQPQGILARAGDPKSYERKVIGAALLILALLATGAVVAGWSFIRTAVDSATTAYNELKINLSQQDAPPGSGTTARPILSGSGMAACINGIPIAGESPTRNSYNPPEQNGTYYLYRYPAMPLFEIQIPLYKDRATIDNYMAAPLSAYVQVPTDISSFADLFALTSAERTGGAAQPDEWWGNISLGSSTVQYLFTQFPMYRSSVHGGEGQANSYGRHLLIRWRLNENAMILIANKGPIQDSDFAAAIRQAEDITKAYVAQCAPAQ